VRRKRTIATLAAICAALALSASSASAATISPATADFGTVLVGKSSAPVTFTVTKGSETRFQMRPFESDGRFVGGYLGFEGFEEVSNTCFYQYLTATNPSCTITVNFSPYISNPARLGRQKGFVIANDLERNPVTGLLDPRAELTGRALAFNPARCKKAKTKRLKRQCRRLAGVGR